MPKLFTVNNDYHDSRFDKWFKKNVIDVPHSLIEKIIRQNKVKVNNKRTKSSYRVQEGDIVQIFEISKFKPSKKDTKIKYKPNKNELREYSDYIIENNENFVIINKPTGIPVQSGTKSFRNMVDILKDTIYFQNSKPYIVHRIDKETSGILIIAKSKKYAQLFTSLFRIRKIHKTYLAIVYGKVNKSIRSMKNDLIYYENKKKTIQKALTNLKIIRSN
ncbi:RluA family pseudouridine synthase, partial [Candidatus Pelagibacter bacterium]|nr:RluA family pseudouridine synthase [Candidatus Pelagibacter bacterium]